MSCDCNQGFMLPGVNRGPCGCQHGYQGRWNAGMGRLMAPLNHKLSWGLAGLMGDMITQGLGPVDPGAQFQFGFNIPLLGTCVGDPSDQAAGLESDGISYDTTASNLGSFIHPYIAIEGSTITGWNSGTDLANAIYQSITSRGCSVDQSSIQFRVQLSGQGQTLSGTPYPAGGGGGGGGLDLKSLGLGAGLGVGGGVLLAGAFVLVILLAKR